MRVFKMKKIVIIGANDFQKPLIQKAKTMGYETHVFAWREGATGAEDADFFYEISITEKDQILNICRKIQPDAVATIGSDLANITVQYLAEKLGLPGNSRECIKNSTNKASMRLAFQKAGIPVPFFKTVEEGEKYSPQSYPVIVKPTDRSGSRAITKVYKEDDLAEAVMNAASQSFEKKAIIEEYIEGAEYSVETISYKGHHTCLAVTKKYTTGSPHYIEVAHIQPAPLTEEMENRVKKLVFRALDALGVVCGAAHSELRISKKGEIRIIEIGSRMGGDCIGSDLVPLSTGQDFVRMVVDTASGNPPVLKEEDRHVAAIRFLMNENDEKLLAELKEKHPDKLRKVVIEGEAKKADIVDSGSRPGFFILQAASHKEMEELLHHGPWENPLEGLPETPVQKLGFSGGEISWKAPEIPGWQISSAHIPCNHFYMKRDDLLPFSFGGNKVRFAQKFLEDMKREHCDSMIIYGNYHSNLCRILSTLCHKLGMPCYMVHNTEDIKEQKETQNSRVIRAMGVREIPCGKTEIAHAVQQAMDELTEKGYRPYYIYGNTKGQGREWVPVEAYAEAYEEICRQEEEKGVHFDYIFLASSTNATQAGLLAGSLKAGDNRKIIGISVSRNAKRGKEVIASDLNAYADKFGYSFPEDWKEHIYFTDEYLGDGYGRYSSKTADIIRKIYGEEGIPLDMTYTGKAFYGMVRYLEEHQIHNKNILFLHTGGTPLFFDFLEENDL